jgi:hypothetical protein
MLLINCDRTSPFVSGAKIFLKTVFVKRLCKKGYLLRNYHMDIGVV